MRLAWFVTPHGFGHAARAAAVIEEMLLLEPEVELDLWTWVPAWFWRTTLPETAYRIRAFPVDVGMIQRSPFLEDPQATVARLESWWLEEVKPRWHSFLEELKRSGVQAVVADIAPLGLELARAAGLPAVLVENFTWDWIYQAHVEGAPGLAPWLERFQKALEGAQLRLAVEPACPSSVQSPRTPVPPVARKLRSCREAVRVRLGVPEGVPLILVSFGGVPCPSPRTLASLEGRAVVAVVGAAPVESWEGSWRYLPHRCPVYHPDLLHAADLWVGKPGYSTVVEVARSGSRALLIPRPGFREGAVLESWLRERLPVRMLDLSTLEDGSWLETALEWLELPAGTPTRAPGAREVAQTVLSWLRTH